MSIMRNQKHDVHEKLIAKNDSKFILTMLQKKKLLD